MLGLSGEYLRSGILWLEKIHDSQLLWSRNVNPLVGNMAASDLIAVNRELRGKKTNRLLEADTNQTEAVWV